MDTAIATVVEKQPKADKFRNNYRKLHEENIIGNAGMFIGAVQQFYSDFTQPSKAKVDKAMILSISDKNGSGVEYSLKAGGGAKADSLYEALIKIDGVAIYKKYSTVFNKVLITGDELKGLLKPLIPTNRKIDNVVHNVTMGLREVALERRGFDDINWAGLDNLSFISVGTLLDRIEKNVDVAVATIGRDNPTTRKGCLDTFDWERMDKSRLPKILSRNRERMRKINRMPALFQRLKSHYNI